MYPVFVAENTGEHLSKYINTVSGRIHSFGILTQKEPKWIKQSQQPRTGQPLPYAHDILYDTIITSYIAKNLATQAKGIATLHKDMHEAQAVFLTEKPELLDPYRSSLLYARLGDPVFGDGAEFAATPNDLVNMIRTYEKLNQ